MPRQHASRLNKQDGLVYQLCSSAAALPAKQFQGLTVVYITCKTTSLVDLFIPWTSTYCQMLSIQPPYTSYTTNCSMVLVSHTAAISAASAASKQAAVLLKSTDCSTRGRTGSTVHTVWPGGRGLVGLRAQNVRTSFS